MTLKDIQNLKYNDYVVQRKLNTYRGFIDLQYPENMSIYRFIINRQDKKTIILENVSDSSSKNLLEVPYKSFLENYCSYEDLVYDYNYFLDESDITLDFLKQLNILTSKNTHVYKARIRMNLLDEITKIKKYYNADYEILKYISQLEKGVRRCSKRLYTLDNFIKTSDINIKDDFNDSLILHVDYLEKQLINTKKRIERDFQKLKNDYKKNLNEE